MPSVVFEPILGGARPMRGGGADPKCPFVKGPTITVNDKWKWHMKADIAHDGGAAILGYTSMNLAAVYGGKNTKIVDRDAWDKLPLDEDTVRDTLLASDLYMDRAGRPSVHFLLRPATDQFTDEAGKSIVFDPFQGQLVAVYHDAGLPMYTRIPNARNALGFGTPADPAPKPIEDNSIIRRFTGPIRIPGCTFGFNPAVVGDIVIADFDGTRVKVGVYIKIDAAMQLYDAATGTPILDRDERKLTYKQINKPTGLFAGNGANGRMTGSPRDIPYFIGKALGDALQVPACMPKIWDNGGNLIYNPGYAGGIAKVILNTGDRLEYVRAVLLGVSCIYLGPKDAETKARTGVFTPGSDAVKSDGQLRKEYNKKLLSVYASARGRWEECITSIKGAINPDGTFNVAYSYFGGISLLTTDDQRVRAGAFMTKCKHLIEEACEKMVGLGDNEGEIGVKNENIAEGGYFGSSIAAAIAVESVADKIAAYSQLLSELDSHCPPGAILRRSNMPQVFRVSSTETTEVTIKFLKGFEAIKNGGDWTSAIVDKGYEDVEEDVAGGARRKQVLSSAAIRAAAAAAVAHSQAQKADALRTRIQDSAAKTIRTAAAAAEAVAAARALTLAAPLATDNVARRTESVNNVNAFTCMVNAEQSRILGIRSRDAGGNLLLYPKVYGSEDLELTKEWTYLWGEYHRKATIDLSIINQLDKEISDEVNAGYGDPEYAILAGVVARVVADEKNQNDFTEFVKFLFSDLTYPSLHTTEADPLGNVDTIALGAEDNTIMAAEKQTFKAVRFAFTILRLAMGQMSLIDPVFHEEMYGQAALLMSIAPMPPAPPPVEMELPGAAAAAAEGADEEFGGSRRKTHRRRLPKLI